MWYRQYTSNYDLYIGSTLVTKAHIRGIDSTLVTKLIYVV